MLKVNEVENANSRNGNFYRGIIKQRSPSATVRVGGGRRRGLGLGSPPESPEQEGDVGANNLWLCD
jgi:hypothetical protein